MLIGTAGVCFLRILGTLSEGRVWFPCRPSYPRFRLTTTQTRWKVHQPFHQSNLDQLSVPPTLYDNHDTGPFRSSKQNLSRKTPQLSVVVAHRSRHVSPQPRHRLFFICQQFAPRFATLLRHQSCNCTPCFWRCYTDCAAQVPISPLIPPRS
jgi:hypothetical protein